MTSNPNDPTWYVRSPDGKATGPRSVTQILIAMQAGRMGADTMVASVTERKWVPASAIPEVASWIDENGSSPFRPGSVQPTERIPWHKMRRVAQAQRRLLRGVLITWLIGLVSFVISRVFPGLFVPVLLLVSVMCFLVLAAYADELIRALNLPSFVWFVGFVIPCVNMLFVLDLIAKATAYLRHAGVEVGFFGATLPEEPPKAATPIADRAKARRRRW